MAAVSQQNMSWTSMPGAGPAHYPASLPSYHQPPPPHRLQHQQYISAPSYHSDGRMSFDPMGASAAAATSHRGGYEAYAASHSDAHLRMHTFDNLYASQIPMKKHTRHKLYPSEEARAAAKLAQKARRREQNRNAQRRLRDRKEEHIFKLESEIALLRRQDEEHRGEVQNLEEMVRRLVEQRTELHRKLESLGVAPPAESNDWETAPRLAPIQKRHKSSEPLVAGGNALGLSEYDNSPYPSSSPSVSSSRSSASEHDAKEGVSPLTSCASSISVTTPRSPSFLSPSESRSRALSIQTTQPASVRGTNSLYSSEPGSAQLPRIKLDAGASMLVPNMLPSVTSQWVHQ